MTATVELVGYQSPRLSNFPLYHTTLGDDAIDLAELAGLRLLPWQEMLIRESLGESRERTSNGTPKFSASNVCLITPRQNGKNFVVYVRELAGLFLLGERIIHTAHEFATADDAWKELKAIIEGCDLDDECLHPHLHGGAEVSIRHSTNGGFIRYRARGNGSMRGITRINMVVADEAFALDDRQMGSFKPIMQAAERRQLWLTSSAGFDTSEVLSRFREQGIEGSNPRLLFAEWSCPEGADPVDRENWRIANPSLGVDGIAPLDALEDNFMTLSVQEFAREHLGMWDDPAMTSVIPFDAWEACTREFEHGVSPIVGDRVVALDVAPQMEWASIVGAGRDLIERSHVEVVKNDKGTDWVIPTFKRMVASERCPVAVAVQAGGKSGMFGPELEQLGLKVVYLSQQEVGRATARFESDIAERSLTHYDDPHLKAGLGGADKYLIGSERGGGWGWLRRGTSVDITGIVAASYANHLLMLVEVERTLAAPRKYRMAKMR